MYDLWKSLISEFLGTFILVFVGAGASAVAIQNGGNPITTALALGLAYIGLIYIFSNFSSANFNPVLSFSLALSGRLSWCRMILYWIVQFLGALAGAALINWIYGQNFGVGSNFGIGNGNMTAQQPAKVLIIEMILTFFFVLVFLFMTKNPFVSMISGFVIGLTLVACLLVGGRGAFVALNPALSLSTLVFNHQWANFWVFLVGPLIGSIIAVIVYRLYLIHWTCAEIEAKGCNLLCGETPFYEEHKDCGDATFMARGRMTYEANKAELEAAGDVLCGDPCNMPKKCETRGRKGYKYVSL